MQAAADFDRELVLLRRDHAVLREEWTGLKHDYYARKFDPGQPRAPKGSPIGGQWIRLLLGLHPLGRVALAGLTLYELLAAQKERNRQALIGFDAREFRLDGRGELNLEGITQIDRERVSASCPRFPEVQERTDQAVDTVRQTRGLLPPAEFGTAVHVDLKNQIKGIEDPNFRAEVSYLKSIEENYGTKGSIRVDVLERVGDGTVCVYDIKTGKRGLSGPRMIEIAGNVMMAYSDTTRIVVTEVRPRR